MNFPSMFAIICNFLIFFLYASRQTKYNVSLQNSKSECAFDKKCLDELKDELSREKSVKIGFDSEINRKERGLETLKTEYEKNHRFLSNMDNTDFYYATGQNVVNSLRLQVESGEEEIRYYKEKLNITNLNIEKLKSKINEITEKIEKSEKQ